MDNNSKLVTNGNSGGPSAYDPNAPQKANLRKLFHHYIVPQIQDVNQFQEPEDEEQSEQQSTQKEVNSSRSLGGTRSFRVLHNQIVYTSAETSRHILRTNRETYLRMMERLRTMEQKEYTGAQQLCLLRKKRLNYFNYRSRESREETKSMIHAEV